LLYFPAEKVVAIRKDRRSMGEGRLALGIDVGSVSVDAAVLDQDGRILETRYVRHKGKPMQAAAEVA
jgi:activator of 2-hydroxyglutaryl-CoA dehydratase